MGDQWDGDQWDRGPKNQCNGWCMSANLGTNEMGEKWDGDQWDGDQLDAEPVGWG